MISAASARYFISEDTSATALVRFSLPHQLAGWKECRLEKLCKVIMDFGRSVAVVDLFRYSVMWQMRETKKKKKTVVERE